MSGTYDGSIRINTKIDTVGAKKGFSEITKFAQLSMNEQRSLAQSLSGVYRKQGLNQSEAQKKAWDDLKTNKVAVKDLEQAYKDMTHQVDKYGTASKKSGNTAKSAVDKVSTSLKRLGSYLMTYLSITAIWNFSKEAGQMATSTEASVQRLIDIYGQASDKIGDFIDSNARALGMSKSAAASYASVYGNLFSVWADQATNANLTNHYLNMTAVVASKTGREVADVQERIRSGLLGNTEAIEDLGIFVNVKTIEMTDAFKRMADGKSWEKLDAYTQQQIRSMAILEQATKKYGTEVANTSALTRMRFNAAFEDFKNTWGQVVNKILLPILRVGTMVLNVLTRGLQIIAKLSGKTLDTATEQSNAIAGSVDNQNDLTDAVKGTNKELKKSLAGFDELNTLSQDTSSGSGGGSSSAGLSDLGLEEVNALSVGDIDTSELENSLSKIENKLKSIWNSEPVQAFVGAVQTSFDFLSNYISTMWDNVRNNTMMTWQNIQGDLQLTGQNLTTLWTNVWTDFTSALNTWGQPIIDGISGLFNSIWATAIDPAVQYITSAWSDFTGILLELWNEHGQPLLDNIGEFVDNVIGLFQSIYDNVLEPIITPLLETMKELWDEHLSDLVEKVGDFILSLINGALEIYNKFIDPIVKFLLEVLSPAWTTVTNFVIGVVGQWLADIIDVASSVIGAFTGIVDFIAGVFTGNWEKAWEGVKSVFKNIVEGLATIIKSPINVIISMINSFIAGLNKIKLPEWEGLGSLAGKGFNIPKIPKLAQGTVLPGGKPFMAIVNDQPRGQTNIEAPLDTIKQGVAEVLASMNVGSGFNGRIEVPIYLDGRQIALAVREAENNLGTQTVFGGFANAY